MDGPGCRRTRHTWRASAPGRIRRSDGTRSTISSNVFQDNAGDGLHFDRAGTTDGQFVVKGNTSTGNGGAGFEIDVIYVAGTTSGNTARYNGREGFRATGYVGIDFGSSSTDRCYANNGGVGQAQYTTGWSCVTTSR